MPTPGVQNHLLSHRSDDLPQLRRLLLRIPRPSALLLRKYFRLCSRLHLRGLRSHHTILARRVHRSIRGCLDYFRFLDRRFRTGRIRAGIQTHLAAHCIALPIRSNSVSVGGPPGGVGARYHQMRPFVSPHMPVSIYKLTYHCLFIRIKLLRSSTWLGALRQGTCRVRRRGNGSSHGSVPVAYRQQSQES